MIFGEDARCLKRTDHVVGAHSRNLDLVLLGIGTYYLLPPTTEGFLTLGFFSPEPIPIHFFGFEIVGNGGGDKFGANVVNCFVALAHSDFKS